MFMVLIVGNEEESLVIPVYIFKLVMPKNESKDLKNIKNIKRKHYLSLYENSRKIISPAEPGSYQLLIRYPH